MKTWFWHVHLIPFRDYLNLLQGDLSVRTLQRLEIESSTCNCIFNSQVQVGKSESEQICERPSPCGRRWMLGVETSKLSRGKQMSCENALNKSYIGAGPCISHWDLHLSLVASHLNLLKVRVDVALAATFPAFCSSLRPPKNVFFSSGCNNTLHCIALPYSPSQE